MRGSWFQRSPGSGSATNNRPGKFGFKARNEAANKVASYCRRPAWPTTTTLNGLLGPGVRFEFEDMVGCSDRGHRVSTDLSHRPVDAPDATRSRHCPRSGHDPRNLTTAVIVRQKIQVSSRNPARRI